MRCMVEEVWLLLVIHPPLQQMLEETGFSLSSLQMFPLFLFLKSHTKASLALVGLKLLKVTGFFDIIRFSEMNV